MWIFKIKYKKQVIANQRKVVPIRTPLRPTGVKYIISYDFSHADQNTIS